MSSMVFRIFLLTSVETPLARDHHPAWHYYHIARQRSYALQHACLGVTGNLSTNLRQGRGSCN